METDNSIESQIAVVLSDIHQRGYSLAQNYKDYCTQMSLYEKMFVSQLEE